jgi:CBS domain-containing protein
MATNGSGIFRQTTSSTSDLSAAIVSAGATGTASTSARGRRRRDEGRAHAGAGGDAVVHQDYRPAIEGHALATRQIRLPAALDLGQLLTGQALDIGARKTSLRHHVVVGDDLRLPAIHHGGSRQLPLVRDADLAHQHDVERRLEAARDLGGNRHAPARHRQHHRIGKVLVPECAGQHAPSLAAIGKRRWPHVLTASKCSEPASGPAGNPVKRLPPEPTPPSGTIFASCVLTYVKPGQAGKIVTCPLWPSRKWECAMKVKDAMHQGAEWVEPQTPIDEIARKMRDLDIGAIPVGENDRLIGMVTDRDIACRAVANGTDPGKLTARDVMSKGILYCRETEDLEDAMRIMEQKQVRRLPVINDRKRMVGMLSLGDIADAASHELSGEVIAAVSAHHA